MRYVFVLLIDGFTECCEALTGIVYLLAIGNWDFFVSSTGSPTVRLSIPCGDDRYTVVLAVLRRIV